MAQKKRKAAAAKTTSKTAVSVVKPAAKAARKTANDMELLFFPTLGKTDQTMEKIMTKNKAQMEKMTADATVMGREGVEAMIKSSTTFFKGFEDIMRAATEMAQSTAEKQTQFVKQAMSSKTLNEWSETQNKMAQASFDDFMAGATKISEMSIKLFTEASGPLNEQMSKGMKKASDAASAAA